MKKLLSLLLLLASGPALADPVSAIVSIGSMASAAGGVAAIGTAVSTGLAGMTLASGLQFVGGAIGLVGSLTGNKKLRNIGGLMALGGGLTSLFKDGAAGAAGDAAKSAGKEALGQTPVAPVDEAYAAQAAGKAAEGAVPAGAVPAGAADFGAPAEVGEPMVQSFAQASEATKSAAKDTSLIGRLAEGIKSNKELVKIGAGLVSGAAQGYMQREAVKDQEAALVRQQGRFSRSVEGVNPMGQFINPNAAAVTDVAPQDPMRYIPRRGLVRRAAQPGG